MTIRPSRRAASALVLLASAAPVLGQAAQRAAFVANNGNAEGSVTSYTLAPDGSPVFVAKYITGGSGSPGTNAYAITLAPGGRFLAVTHATASQTVERLTMLAVNADATLSPVAEFTTPDSPLDAAFVRDDLLAVTLTNTSAPNKVIMYRFQPAGPTLTELDREDAGAFCAYLALSPDRTLLYASDSGQNTLRAFRVNPDGTLTPLAANPTGLYPLGPGFTGDGRRLYAGSGISGGANQILAFDVNAADGSLTPILGSPFLSPGSGPSPKQAVASSDDRFLFVGHGSSSVVRSFAIDPDRGTLTDTGSFFDVGIQGDLGEIAVLDDLLLFTDKFSGATGLYSFSIQPDGSFTQNGALVSSQGTTPTAIAAWSPALSCYANCDGSTAPPILNVNDFVCFSQRFAAGDPYANCDGSTTLPTLNVNDFVCFSQSFGAGCP